MASSRKPARSTAIAWRRALKAIGVPLDLVHVHTVYNRPKGYRFKEPVYKNVFPPHSSTEQVAARAAEFVALVDAAGFSAHVILRSATGRYPWIHITNGTPTVGADDILLATTDGT